MDWRTVITAFIMVLITEMGDKTQLALILYTSQNKQMWAVLTGAASGLIFASLLAIFVGANLTKIIPAEYIQKVAGAIFILMGLLAFIRG